MDLAISKLDPTDHLETGPACSKGTQWPKKRSGCLTIGPEVLRMDPGPQSKPNVLKTDPLPQKQAVHVKNRITTSKMEPPPQNGPSCLQMDPAVSKLDPMYGKWARCVKKGPTGLKMDHVKNGAACSKWTQWPQKQSGCLTSGPNMLKMDPGPRSWGSWYFKVVEARTAWTRSWGVKPAWIAWWPTDDGWTTAGTCWLGEERGHGNMCPAVVQPSSCSVLRGLGAKPPTSR
ncbi:hypothetical protein BDN67DRAFT_978191 [Paxillus ammoniavirescens]|nr:hypothetical protein BDN67DRAFT_978191 [Paxillus ammoniavirescens]